MSGEALHQPACIFVKKISESVVLLNSLYRMICTSKILKCIPEMYLREIVPVPVNRWYLNT